MYRFFTWLFNIFLLIGVFISVVISSFFYFYPYESKIYWDNFLKKWTEKIVNRTPSKKYSNFGVELPKFSIHGIDVSFYQGDIDWEAVKKMKIKGDSITFVFMKATEGNDFSDKFFAKNWKEAQKTGLICGAYHYFKAELSGEEQAKHFIANVKMVKGNLPPVLDIEELGDKKLPELKRELKIWLDIIEKKYKVKPIIYSGRSFLRDNIGEEFKKYIFWVAQYKNLKNPDLIFQKWSFWQHSSEGNINGINGNVDLNVFEGDNIKELIKITQK